VTVALGTSRHQDHRQRFERLIGLHCLVHLPAIPSGQHQVQQHHVRPQIAHHRQPLSTIHRTVDFAAVAAQREPHQFDHLRLIFDV